MVNDWTLSNVVSGQSCNDWIVSWMVGNCVILRLSSSKERLLVSSGVVPAVIMSVVGMSRLLIMERSLYLSSIMLVSMLINFSVMLRDLLVVGVVTLGAVMSTHLMPLLAPWLNLGMPLVMLLHILCAAVVIVMGCVMRRFVVRLVVVLRCLVV